MPPEQHATFIRSDQPFRVAVSTTDALIGQILRPLRGAGLLPRLGKSDLKILIALASLIDARNVTDEEMPFVWPSARWLMTHTGLRKAATYGALRRLKQLQLIRSSKAGGPGGARALELLVPSQPENDEVHVSGLNVHQRRPRVRARAPQRSTSVDLTLERKEERIERDAPVALYAAAATAGAPAPDVPPSLCTPEFLATWGEWQTYRRQKRNPLTQITMEKQLRKLESWGPAKAIMALERSVENGWAGIFPPQDRGGTNGKFNEKDKGEFDSGLPPLASQRA